MAYGVAALKYSYVRKVIPMEREKLKKVIAAYTGSLETELTEQNCLCEWVEIDTERGKKKVNSTRMGGSVNMECPVHTREGFLLAFIEMHFDPETLRFLEYSLPFRKADHAEAVE
jgi:hypothetical protein